MASSLVPYSFVPGTKAKAEEVNENFIALANQITENKEYVDSKIEEGINSVKDDKANLSLDNTSLISNCVIEAPNGIVSYTGNTITVKAGLKVLIPNGRNDDGSLKSITRTIEEDIVLTTQQSDFHSCVYVTQDSVETANVFHASPLEPVYKDGLWYNMRRNLLHKYNASLSKWEVINGVIIASFKNTSNIISQLKVKSPTGLLKDSDIYAILGFSVPDFGKAVLKGSNTDYIAYVNGYVYGYVESSYNQNKYIYIDGHQYPVGTSPTEGPGHSSIFLPVAKGSTYHISYGNCKLWFIPMKGEE